MALTKDEKNTIVSEIAGLLSSSKMTVVTKYQGTTVKAMQNLRRQVREDGTVAKVVKNRLVIKAIQQNDRLKAADTSKLEGMLLYAFNSEDEVAPAQSIAKFAKTNPSLEFVGAFTADGNFIDASDVQVLANLPSKNQLRGMLVGTLAAPLSGFVNVMAGNVRGVLNVLSARAETIS
jgi:large subunit ribosomal protein L10